jgi:hypothetical protein
VRALFHRGFMLLPLGGTALHLPKSITRGDEPADAVDCAAAPIVASRAGGGSAPGLVVPVPDTPTLPDPA